MNQGRIILKMNDIKVVIFDLGNTLIEFGPKQLESGNKSLFNMLSETFGDLDIEDMVKIRKGQISRPYTNGFIENDPADIARELIRKLYDREIEEDQVNALVNFRYESFLNIAELQGNVLPLLDKLSKTYRIAMISNYPCSRSIFGCLQKTGLAKYMEEVVISADVGFVKPHPVIFKTMLDKLDLLSKNCVYIGDNWLADVQGAKRAGMKSILTTEYKSYMEFERNKDDFSPDRTINNIEELINILLQ
jgi:putative hydrolase of the HAD superfamily